MTDNQVIIICAPYNGPDDLLIEGSETDVCAYCGGPISIAPSGRAVQAEHQSRNTPVDLVCAPCGLKQLRHEPEAKVQPITSRQKTELKTAIEKGKS